MERFTDTHIIIYRVKQQIGTHKLMIFLNVFVLLTRTVKKKHLFQILLNIICAYFCLVFITNINNNDRKSRYR